MPAFAASRNLLRPRDENGSGVVTQIELFFDLVFVFAITQVSQTLRHDLSALAALRALILFVSVWWVWVYTSWLTNWLNPEERPVRVLLIALMLAGLALSTSLPAAFGARGGVYAAAYVVMQVGRSLFMLWAVRHFDAANFRNFQRITIWLLVSGVFWIAGGLTAAGPRLWLWLVALGCDFCAPALGFRVPGLGRSTTTDWKIDSFHLADRCSAFVLIALGESITVTGATFYGLHWTVINTVVFTADFMGAVALWWIYFDTAAENTSHAFAKSEDPGRVGRAAYTYMHGVIVAGIILTAVADELALAHPLARPDPAVLLVTIGGPALYLAGNGVFRRMLAPRFPLSHSGGLAAFAALALAGWFLPLLALAVATSLVLLGVAAAGSVLQHRQEARA